MNRYEGALCPYCQQPIHENDDVTVCPLCGAPYHRECAQKSGGCVLTELHEKGEQWQKIPRPGAREVDGRAGQRCSRCGTLNNPGANFCEICGNPLQNQEPIQQDEDLPPYLRQDGWQQGGIGQQIPPQMMPFNPFVNPMGGLDPEEQIEDIPAKEVALFVRSNTPYFLPKFKEMARKDEKKRAASWNWSAFLFDCYYLFYRKMYGLGAIVMALSLIFSIPSMMLYFDSMLTLLDESSSGLIALMGISSDKLMILSNMCSFFSLVMKLLLAMFANKLYKDHTFKSIRKIREEKGEAEDYHATLTAKGGISFTALIIALGITFAASVLASFVFLRYMGF